jgi:hypothetical protein
MDLVLKPGFFKWATKFLTSKVVKTFLEPGSEIVPLLVPQKCQLLSIPEEQEGEEEPHVKKNQKENNNCRY